jgi:hypothetical protein
MTEEQKDTLIADYPILTHEIIDAAVVDPQKLDAFEKALAWAEIEAMAEPDRQVEREAEAGKRGLSPEAYARQLEVRIEAIVGAP